MVRQPLSSPVRFALTPEGDVFVSESSQRRVLLIDRATLDVVGEIPIRGQPVGIAWAGDALLVGNATTGRVETYARHGGGWGPRGRSPAPPSACSGRARGRHRGSIRARGIPA